MVPLLKGRRGNSPPFLELPLGNAGSKASLTLTPERAYLALLPRDGLGKTASGLGFVVDTVSSANDPVDVGLYKVDAGQLTLLGSSGATRARLWNAGGGGDEVDPRRASLAFASPIELPDIADVYAAIGMGPVQGTPAGLSASDLGNSVYLPGSMALAAPGKTKAFFKDGSFPLPASVVEPTGLTVVPNMVVLFQRRIVCVGDSMTKGQTNVSSYPTRGLSTRLGPYACVINAGVGHDTTADTISRLKRDVYDHKPFECFVLVGFNDINNEVPTSTITANLKAIYSGIAANGGQPWALTVVPFGNHVRWNSTKEAARNEVNEFIRTAGYPYVDLDPVLADTSDPSRVKLQPAFEGDDRLHLTGAANDAIGAALFAKAFRGKPVPQP